MALNHSPKVVTDGLVFYYDMSNTKKSNIGDTTTNIISNGDFSNGLTNWSNYALATAPFLTAVYDFPTALGQAKQVLQCNTLAAIHGGGNYGGTYYFPFPTLTTGTTYTLSAYVRSASGPMRISFSNQSGGGDNSNLSFTNFNIGSNWTRVQNTVSLDLQKNTLYIWNQTVANGVFQLADIQLEAKSTATAFTSSSRSNVQSIVDLTGRNTITANSITYSDANTFSFNGTSNYITAPSLGTFSSYTIDLWVKMNSLSGEQRLFSTPGGGTFTVRWAAGSSDFNFHYNPFDGSPPSTATSVTGLTYNTSTYYNLVATNSPANGALFYVNGELRSTGERAIDFSGTCYFGVDRTLSLWANCILPAAKIYSRELSAIEIRQNFNALRGRYGI